MVCGYCDNELKEGDIRCSFCGKEAENRFFPKQETIDIYKVPVTSACAGVKKKKKIKPVKAVWPVIAVVLCVMLAMSAVAANAGTEGYTQYSEDIVSTTAVEDIPVVDTIEESEENEIVFLNVSGAEVIVENSVANEKNKVNAAAAKANPEVIGAAGYIGKTYETVFENFGTEFSINYVNGGNFISYRNQGENIFFGALPGFAEGYMPDEIKNETIDGIFVTEDCVYKNLDARMTYSQLKELIPDIEESYFDEMDEVYHASFIMDDYEFTYTWLEDPGNGQLSACVYIMCY